MSKEIFEITKKFHDTYEKLAKEYSYETREDTKVFNINSNNGMLMYSVVNEIVSPILKENQELKEKFKATNKGLQKVLLRSKKWKHRYELAKHEIKELKSQLKGTTHCFDEEEHERLKKQLHEASLTIQEMIEQDIWCPSSCDKLEKLTTQQKVFIKYLEDEIKFYKNRDSYMVADILGSYDLNNIELELLENILQKYKEIVNGTKRN